MTRTAYTAQRVFLDGEFHTGAFIEVERGEIQATGDQPSQGAEIVDFGEAAIFPGAVNTHTHSHLSLLRGRYDGMEINAWLKAIYAAVAEFGTEESYLAGALAFGEALLSGTTTVTDFFYLNGRGNDNARAVIQAAQDLGIRLVMGRTFLDAEWGGEATRETVEVAVGRFRELRQDHAGSRIVQVVPAPHSVVGASRPMIEAAYSLAEEFDSRWYIHIAYDRLSAVLDGEPSLLALDRWGVLDQRIVSVHDVRLEEAELDLLGERGGRASYCPASEMMFGEPVLDLPGLYRRGIQVGLGTDGAASNNTQDMFAEMRSASLCQRLAAQRADVVSIDQMLDLGTASGGVVIGHPVGRLSAGYRADFIVLDTSDVVLQPLSALKSHMVHSMTPRAIRHVYVDGEPAVRDRQLVNLDFAEIRARIHQLAVLS